MPSLIVLVWTILIFISLHHHPVVVVARDDYHLRHLRDLQDYSDTSEASNQKSDTAADHSSALGLITTILYTISAVCGLLYFLTYWMCKITSDQVPAAAAATTTNNYTFGDNASTVFNVNNNNPDPAPAVGLALLPPPLAPDIDPALVPSPLAPASASASAPPLPI